MRDTELSQTAVEYVSMAPMIGRDSRGWLLFDAYVKAVQVTEKRLVQDNFYLVDGVLMECEEWP